MRYIQLLKANRIWLRISTKQPETRRKAPIAWIPIISVVKILSEDLKEEFPMIEVLWLNFVVWIDLEHRQKPRDKGKNIGH